MSVGKTLIIIKINLMQFISLLLTHKIIIHFSLDNKWNRYLSTLCTFFFKICRKSEKNLSLTFSMNDLITHYSIYGQIHLPDAFTYGSISTLRTTHLKISWQGFSSLFAKFLQKMKKNLVQKFTDESSVKYLWIYKWGRWIQPMMKV